MSIDIRAMSFSEILDQSIRELRANFSLLVGIAAVFQVPLAIVGTYMQVEQGTAPGSTFWIAWAILMGVALIGMPWCQLAIVHAISESALERPCTLRSAYGFTAGRYVPYLGTSILAMLGIGFGLMLLVIPGIYLAVAWLLIGPVVVIEKIGGPRALGRSRELISGYWWRAAGVMILTAIVGGVVTGGFQWMFGFIPLIGPVLSGFVGAIGFAFYSSVAVVLYFDLRCRSEDFDLQLLAEGIGADAAAQPAGAL